MRTRILSHLVAAATLSAATVSVPSARGEEIVHHLAEVWGTCSPQSEDSPEWLHAWEGLDGIAVDEDHVFALEIASSLRIHRFSKSGEHETSWICPASSSLYGFAWDLATDGRDHVYLADSDASVFQYASNGNLLARWGRADGGTGAGDGEFRGPSGIDVDREGIVFVADLNARVQRFAEDGTFLGSWVSPAWTPERLPLRVACLPDGGLFVITDGDSFTVFSPQGSVIREGELPVPQPFYRGGSMDVAADDHGTLYVLLEGGTPADTQYRGYVLEMSQEGELRRFWRAEPSTQHYCPARSIDVDSDGFVFVDGGWALKKFWYEGVAVRATDPLADLLVDGEVVRGLGVLRWEPGSTHEIGLAPTQYPSAGTKLDFVSWQHGGPIDQSIAAPESPATFTATMARSCELTMGSTPGGSVSPSSAWFPDGSQVLLQAEASPDYLFDRWNGEGLGSYTGRVAARSITMNGPIRETATFLTGHFDFTISASETDPFATSAPPANGVRQLHLWMTCADAFASAFEANAVGSLEVLGFCPVNGVLNVYGGRRLLLAFPGSFYGQHVPMRLGYWTVDDRGGDLCLGPSENGLIAVADCTAPEPHVWSDPRVEGFSSTAGPPCVVGSRGCLSPSEPGLVTNLHAVSGLDRVVITWNVEAGIGYEGFSLWRSSHPVWLLYELITPEPLDGHAPWEFVDSDILPNRTYTYRLDGVDGFTRTFRYGPLEVTTNSVARRDVVAQDVVRLQPNPFARETRLSFQLAAPSPTRIAIYDVTGRLVSQLVDERLGPGAHTVTWEGRDAAGRQVPAGVYFARLKATEFEQTRKLVYLGSK